MQIFAIPWLLVYFSSFSINIALRHCNTFILKIQLFEEKSFLILHCSPWSFECHRLKARYNIPIRWMVGNSTYCSSSSSSKSSSSSGTVVPVPAVPYWRSSNSRSGELVRLELLWLVVTGPPISRWCHCCSLHLPGVKCKLFFFRCTFKICLSNRHVCNETGSLPDFRMPSAWEWTGQHDSASFLIYDTHHDVAKRVEYWSRLLNANQYIASQI